MVSRHWKVSYCLFDVCFFLNHEDKMKVECECEHRTNDSDNRFAYFELFFWNNYFVRNFMIQSDLRSLNYFDTSCVVASVNRLTHCFVFCQHYSRRLRFIISLILTFKKMNNF